MNDVDDQSSVPMADVAPKAPMKVGGPSSGGMGLRLGIILGIAVLALGTVLGFRVYLDAQVPKGDPNFVRPESSSSADPGANEKGTPPPAPGA